MREQLATMRLDALAQQAESGKLAEPTPEERTPLADPDALVAALPQRVGDDIERVSGNGFANEGNDPPYVEAHASFGRQPRSIRVTVRAFKSERHAQDGAPVTAEHLARSTMLPEGVTAADVRQMQWNEQTVLVLEIDQLNSVVGLAGSGPVVIRIQASDVETVQQAFEALDFDQLEAAARPQADES